MLWAVSSNVLSSSLGSSMDSRVVGHNSGLILAIKHHICSDTVCPVASYIITQWLVNVLWSILGYGTYQQWLSMINLLKQELSYHPNPMKLNLELYALLVSLKWNSNPYLQYKCWTHFSLHHTVSPKLHTEQTQEKIRQQEKHTRL